MWSALVSFVSKIVGILAPLFIAKKWGESETKREQLEADARSREEDEKIASRPYVPNPFSRMRDREK